MDRETSQDIQGPEVISVVHNPHVPQLRRRKRRSKRRSKDLWNRSVKLELFTLQDAFPSELAAIEYLEERRWKGIPRCAHCSSVSVTKFKTGPRAGIVWQCNTCDRQFTVRVGTIFHKSPLTLLTWYRAIWLFTIHKKSMSSHQLADFLKVTQTTVWHMDHRIRLAMHEADVEFGPDDIVEFDESLFGGKEKFKHQSKRTPNTQGRSTKTKDLVFGIVSRRRGITKTFVIQTADKKTLQAIIRRHVKKGTTVHTDMFKSYDGLAKDYDHHQVDHVAKEYVRGDVHVNTMENRWSGMKRIITGTYHQISTKHRHRYQAELDYRSNTRGLTSAEKFAMVLERIQCRLTYKELTAKAAVQDNRPKK